MKIDLKIDWKTLTESEKKRFQEMYESIKPYLDMEQVKGKYKNEILAYNIVTLIFKKDE